MPSTLKPLFRLALAHAIALCGGAALAQQSQPTPVTMLVGFAPGGTSDAVARVLAQKLPEYLKQPVVVENRTGALGTIALRELANTPAGKPVFALMPFSAVVFPALTGMASGYDPLKDLKPVASVTSYPLGLVVGGDSKVRTPTDLVNSLKAAPGDAQFGTAGAGGHNHFLGLQLAKVIGVEATIVPYKGNGPLITDLIPGHVAAGLMVAGEVTPFVKDGKLRIVGVLTANRSPLMPDVPTFAEHGFPVTAGEAWYGVWTHARASAGEVAQMQDAVSKALATPEVQQSLIEKFAMQPDFRPAAQTEKRLQADFEQWAPVIKASGFKPQ
ncbi:Bug family tripartite tricarboxylate transporter substrate binding protein [Caldimonas thermodepolymerans]|uniref:Tripartite-type tricarboxylate transporter receptor subunit TctC n=1 Tax=Caldimonas thermodepolymerans TaxID=215580 RepID=A0AA46DD14_9BURK|nr:tripartite tricarboxylate transporter substrate binding protein [Caldimonas thermodepolymerans]TCP06198.1 tripartite-type tricarboxylate transporter receptor subunit TctC [Caldimonas thermodepolymerans]UZG48964.1 tripartite tricarboxylate transporter substrate binding protein [Caldimonas thermodepolymerans]